jgi:outer membrane protein assembly factor BamB
VAPGPRGEQVWLVKQPGYAATSPAVSGSVLIVGTGDGKVQARALSTGAVVWQTSVGSAPQGANIVVGAGVAVVGLSTRTVGIDAASGAVRWSYDAPIDSINGRPPVPGSVFGATFDADQELAFVPAWGGTISAIDLQTGSPRWVWSVPPESPNRHGAEGVRVVGNTVYATAWHYLNANGTSAEAWIVALDRATGAERWRTVLPAPGYAVTITGRPAVASGRVFVQMSTGDLFRLDATTGAVQWHLAPETPANGALFASIFSEPVVVDDLVLSESGTGAIRANRVTDGGEVWRAAYQGQFTGAMVASDQLLYGVDGDRLLVFDLAGRQLGILKQPEVADGLFPAPPVIAGGVVYVPVYGGFWAFKETTP